MESTSDTATPFSHLYHTCIWWRQSICLRTFDVVPHLKKIKRYTLYRHHPKYENFTYFLDVNGVFSTILFTPWNVVFLQNLSTTSFHGNSRSESIVSRALKPNRGFFSFCSPLLSTISLRLACRLQYTDCEKSIPFSSFLHFYLMSGVDPRIV